MLRSTLGLLTVGGLLLCSAPASAGPFGLFGGNNGGGPFANGPFAKRRAANDCAPACQPVTTCATQQYVTVAVPNSQLYAQTQPIQQTSYAAPAADCGCSGATYSQPVYSQPIYSQPASIDSGCSTCGSAPAISYSQPATSYSVASSGCGVTTSTCGDPCGSTVTQGYASQSYATQSYSSGVVQTSGSDCGCSGMSGVVSSGMTTSNYGPTTGSVQYGTPMSGTVISSGSAGCSTCSQGTVVDGTQNFGQPVPDQGMMNGNVNGNVGGATNYGSSLQDGGYINEQPLDSTQPGSSNGLLDNNSQDGGAATQAPEVPGSIGGDEA